MARQNVARALSTRAAQGVLDIEGACEVARMAFVENPRWLSGMKVFA